MKTLAWLAACLFAANAHAAESVTSVKICAAGIERRDAVAEARIGLPADARVIDVRESGAGIPFQADSVDDRTLVTILLKGRLASNACRDLQVVSSKKNPRAIEQLVEVDEIDNYQGEPTFRIKTPRATYYYHRGGSGFASLIDNDGKDWISYRPEGGFQGNYRGIPNIAPPNFHPGRPQGKKPSRLLRSGPIRASILSETEDEKWRLVWDFFPTFARMTLLAKGPEPYWILYEGTPGGSFDVEFDYWRNSAGHEMPLAPDSDRWNGKLPEPQWVLFGDHKMNRGLFLALHQPDDHWDEFWHRGSGGMTVFGFGRGPKPQWQYLDAVPATLTIGLVEDSRPADTKLAVELAWRPLKVRVGETRPAE